MTSVAATRVPSEARTKALDFEMVDEELSSVLKAALAQQLAGPSKPFWMWAAATDCSSTECSKPFRPRKPGSSSRPQIW